MRIHQQWAEEEILIKFRSVCIFRHDSGKKSMIIYSGPATLPEFMPKSSRSRGWSTTILIADDEPTILYATAMFLKGCGYNVLTAEDGEEALKAFAEAPRYHPTRDFRCGDAGNAGTATGALDQDSVSFHRNPADVGHLDDRARRGCRVDWETVHAAESSWRRYGDCWTPVILRKSSGSNRSPDPGGSRRFPEPPHPSQKIPLPRNDPHGPSIAAANLVPHFIKVIQQCRGAAHSTGLAISMADIRTSNLSHVSAPALRAESGAADSSVRQSRCFEPQSDCR